MARFIVEQEGDYEVRIDQDTNDVNISVNGDIIGFFNSASNGLTIYKKRLDTLGLQLIVPDAQSVG